MTTIPHSERATTLARATRDTEWLTVAEVATKLRLAKMTIYRHIEAGRFPGTIQAGRSYRVPVSAYDAYVEANEVGR